MAYCYECGEQVAENDTFCPYCGIALQQIAVAGDDDDALSKTIVVQQPVATAPKTPEISSLKTPASAVSVSQNEPALKERLIADDKANDTVSEDDESEAWDADFVPVPKSVASGNEASSTNINSENESFLPENDSAVSTDYSESVQNSEVDITESDIPTPKILEALNSEGEFSTAGNFSSDEETKQSSSTELKVEETAQNDDSADTFDKTESEFDLQNESSLMSSYEEEEVKEVLSAEEPEISVDDFPETSNYGTGKSSENSQLSNVDTDVFDAQGDSVEPALEFEDEFLDDAAYAVKSDSSSVAANVESPIVMPEVELPVAESNPPSKFDSVSIMENNAERELFSDSHAPEFAAQPNESKVVDSPKDNISFTSPIAANTDTGGKNKTKLKPLDEGTVLNGRYEIIRKIGGGGMGAVYLASDKNLGGVLRAVKEMVQSYIEDEQQEKAVNDFKRESLLLTSLDHQSIPTIYDYFFDEKEARFYLVMKYISGGDLAGRLRSAPEGRIDEKSVTQWAIQIADVLDYLHNRQPPIVYRDLKPANIMVDSNSGRVMLIDFGIARWVNKEEKGVTAVGTMGYAPPELFSGNVEARSDIYSLGSTMFHLLTGADPQSNPLLIFDFQKHPRPRQINPQLSDQMERILMRAVEYNADKRFASAAELRRSLEEHFESLKVGRATFGVKEAPSSVALSDQPVFCGFCGQKIVATDMFCAFCGAKQPLAQQGVHSENYSAVPLTAQLLIIGTNELEQPAFRLEKENNLIGRRDPMSNIFPEVDLSKYDPQTKISRRHARIWREGNEFMVEDLGSSNGTYLLPVVNNAMRLQPHKPQLLTNGDKLKLGDTTLHFIFG